MPSATHAKLSAGVPKRCDACVASSVYNGHDQGRLEIMPSFESSGETDHHVEREKAF